jgi:DNA-binding NarL/FixJ family response regulator
MDRIRVAVVDDHPLFRQGVAQIVSTSPRMELISEGASAKDAVAIADRKKPDVLILDVGLPGCGMSALEAIAATHPEIKVLMLSVSDSRTDVHEAFRLGAWGYLGKGLSGSELLEAVVSVSEGHRYLSSCLGAQLVCRSMTADNADVAPRHQNLSVREAEILALVKVGLSNKVIGARLRLSDKTVKHYMTGLFHKLGVHSRLEAALSAVDDAPVSRPPPHSTPVRLFVRTTNALKTQPGPAAPRRQFLQLEYDQDARTSSRKG